jgi:hypothetical protein
MMTPIEAIFESIGLYTGGLIDTLTFFWPSLTLVAVFGLLYLVARVYLVVECFINLAYLPDEVYRELEWSNMIPHFGSG